MKSFWALLHRKFFRNFLASLLLVFVLPIIMLTIIMSSALRSTEQEMLAQRRLLLEQFKSSLDTQLISLQRMGEKLVADDKVLYFATREDPLAHLNSSTTFEMVRQLLRELGTISNTNSNIERCYLYFPRNDKVLSNGTVYESRQYYLRYLSGKPEEFDAWLNYLQQEHSGFVYGSPGGYSTENGTIAYMRTIAWGPNAAVSIVLTLDNAALMQTSDVLTAQGQAKLAIYDQAGLPLYASTPALFSPDFVTADPAYRERGQTAYLYSTDTRCTYMMEFSGEQYAARLTALRWQMVGILLGTLLLGILAALLLARRNYQPIRSLMAFVGGEETTNAASTDDDFSYLQQVLSSMADEKLTVAQRLRYQSHTMRGYLLERLLTGNYPNARRMEEELLAQDIVFASDAFVVIMARLDGFEETGASAGDAPQDPDYQLFRFAAANVLEELLATCAQVYVHTLEGNIAALVNLPQDTPENLRALEEPLRHTCALLAQHFGLELSLVSSGIHIGLPGIPDAYQETMGLLVAHPEPKTFWLSWRDQPDAAADPEHRELHAAEWQTRLTRLLLSDGPAAARELAALYAQVTALPPWRGRLVMGDILSACYRAVLLAQPTPQQQTRWETTLAHLQAGRPGENPLPALQELAEAVADSAQGRAEGTKAAQLVERVRGYIAQHYQEDGLSIGQIADYLGIHPSYASSLYRRQTGESMLDAINAARLTQAKRLLLGTRQSVESIATTVGYYDSAALIRAMKKYECVTPGQYRALHRPVE